MEMVGRLKVRLNKIRTIIQVNVKNMVQMLFTGIGEKSKLIQNCGTGF